MTHPFKIAIPARYASTRLPGKPLREIAGRPMIQHVWERALESGAEEVVIATDDERIRSVAEGFGAQVCMTAADHPTGTDRLAEVVRRLEWPDQAIVVNLQGDEPLMPVAPVRQVAAALDNHAEAGIATLCTPIDKQADLFDPNVVKVVRDNSHRALYFSRAPIPWERNTGGDAHPAGRHLRHVGMYAYRAGFLHHYADMPPCALEQMESLEQLRALCHGVEIVVEEALELPGHGVDTEQDLARVTELLAVSRQA